MCASSWARTSGRLECRPAQCEAMPPEGPFWTNVKIEYVAQSMTVRNYRSASIAPLFYPTSALRWSSGPSDYAWSVVKRAAIADNIDRYCLLIVNTVHCSYFSIPASAKSGQKSITLIYNNMLWSCPAVITFAWFSSCLECLVADNQ